MSLKLKDLKIGDIFYECEYGENATYRVVEAPVYYPKDTKNDKFYSNGWGLVGEFLGLTTLRFNVDTKGIEQTLLEEEKSTTTNFFASDSVGYDLRIYTTPQYIGG